jgi:elongation factor Ts
MAEISSADVVKLRKMSGQGMMDCKIALAEAKGDMDKAMEILRKKGLATLSKRAERETTEGIVVSKISPDGRQAVLASLCCETDFVSRTDDFISAAEKLADYALVCNADEGVENILKTSIKGKSYNDIVTELASKTGEKTQVGDYARFRLAGAGLIGSYVHFNKKVGSMLLIETSDENSANSAELKQVALDLAMHITATKPLALDKTGIDAKTIETEKSIYAEQAKNKPVNIVEKIVEGKLQKFFAENCLLQQQFVKDSTKTVSVVLDEAAKKAGGKAKIIKFVRFSVG